MDPLHHKVRLAQVDPVGAVHPLQPGIVLVDLEDHRAGALEDGPPGVVGDTQTAIALPVGPGHRDHRHVTADVPIPIEIGQRPQHRRQKGHQTPLLQFALIVADVPAVIGEALPLRVLLHDLDAGADDQAAPDLHVSHLSLPGGQCPVYQLGKARAKAIVHPVAGLHRPGGLFRRNKFRLFSCHALDSFLACVLFRSPSGRAADHRVLLLYGIFPPL